MSLFLPTLVLAVLKTIMEAVRC